MLRGGLTGVADPEFIHVRHVGGARAFLLPVHRESAERFAVGVPRTP
jgi:hypothetical protein